MNELALLHITDSAYCFPISENSIVIRLRTAKNDITDAWVLYESKYKIGEQHNKAVMHKMLRGKLYDYYSVTLTLEDTRLAYVFYLNDGKRYCYFSEDGITESYDFTKGYYNFFQYPFINKSDILPKTDWLSKAVFYQIFVDRFHKGNNEKDSSYINLRWGDLPTPHSFAGGDLKGIVSKLDYIRDLGCDALYLTPIFRSDSNHKYDIIDYFEIDPMFGDKGDLKRLVYEVHKRDMKLVLDAVFNHVSEKNDKFQDVAKNGSNSLYHDWFVIKGDFPRKLPRNYEVFAECDYMPKWNTSNPAVQEYLISVALYYIKKFHIDGLDDIINDYEKKSVAAELGVAAFVVPAQMFLKFGIATTALVGSALLLGGQITVITFFMFLLVVSRLYEPMAGTLINLGALNAAQVNIDRTNEMNDIKKQEGKQEFTPESFDIEFKNVGFEYNDDETVLNDVSFTAKQGEVTALIGPSGGGKTTVSRLAARFWDVTKGRITFGGEDIATVDPEALLKHYSIVFQDVTLFNNTITENIRIGKKDATDEEVLNAARLANCDEFISRLPDGYNTIIGENGAKLSGGERQRISIARAFLKDAPVILLDEATASLDAENETLIQQSLSRLIKNKTVIIIAHRMRTIAGADKIVVIKDGKSDEQGAPKELKNRNDFYTRMLSLQRKE